MSDALAYAVVHGHEGPLRPKSDLHGAAEPLRVAENGGELAGGQIEHRFAMGARDDENVARKERTRVEESYAVVFLHHAMSRDLSASNCAERALAWRHSRVSLLRALSSR
jgi:hypothetical protein